MAKRLVILTGGGDVPGLNSVIKGVTYRGHEMGLDENRHQEQHAGDDKDSKAIGFSHDLISIGQDA